MFAFTSPYNISFDLHHFKAAFLIISILVSPSQEMENKSWLSSKYYLLIGHRICKLYILKICFTNTEWSACFQDNSSDTLCRHNSLAANGEIVSRWTDIYLSECSSSVFWYTSWNYIFMGNSVEKVHRKGNAFATVSRNIIFTLLHHKEYIKFRLNHHDAIFSRKLKLDWYCTHRRLLKMCSTNEWINIRSINLFRQND